jgi:hypothetical protein
MTHVLLYKVSLTAINLYDIVLAPFPPSSAGTLAHVVNDNALLQSKAETFVIPQIVVEPSTILLNGRPIPQKNFVNPQIGTRTFQ